VHGHLNAGPGGLHLLPVHAERQDHATVRIPAGKCNHVMGIFQCQKSRGGCAGCTYYLFMLNDRTMLQYGFLQVSVMYCNIYAHVAVI
jgi:hypothetical protein